MQVPVLVTENDVGFSNDKDKGDDIGYVDLMDSDSTNTSGSCSCRNWRIAAPIIRKKETRCTTTTTRVSFFLLLLFLIVDVFF